MEETMIISGRKKIRRTMGLLAAIVLALLLSSSGYAAYEIGTGDVLEVRFWQEPDLNAQVRVAQDGTISLDVIGEIQAAGKTTEELQTDIVRQISRLNKNISQAIVRVVQYNYNYVYVTGQVANPGKLTFEQIPGLWEIINEAGGATDAADLSRVTIIRGGDKDGGQVQIVNVAQAIANGTLDQLPKITRMDRIDVPQSLMGLPTQPLGRTSEQRNVVYVMGAVTQPGPIQFEEDLDVMEAVALAGGPTPDAEIEKTKVITKDGFYAQSLHFDLKKYSEAGHPVRYTIKKEDAIFIPHRKAGFWDSGIQKIAVGLGIITSALLIYDQINRSDK